MSRVLCLSPDAPGLARKQRAADAGVLEATVAAMRAFPQGFFLHKNGMNVLLNVCGGDGAVAATRKQRASGAGAKAAVERAVAAFPDDDDIQETAALLLEWL